MCVKTIFTHKHPHSRFLSGLVMDSELEKKRIKSLLDAKLIEGINLEAELEQVRFALSSSNRSMVSER